MDSRLYEGIKEFIQGNGSVSEVDPELSERMLKVFSDKYVSKPGQIWWWDYLSVESDSLVYGDEDGLEILADLLAGQGLVYLFVTDDSPAPWTALKGGVADILALIGEQRFFEYLIVNESCTWGVFDTHHNVLCCVGELSLWKTCLRRPG